MRNIPNCFCDFQADTTSIPPADSSADPALESEPTRSDAGPLPANDGIVTDNYDIVTGNDASVAVTAKDSVTAADEPLIGSLEVVSTTHTPADSLVEEQEPESCLANDKPSAAEDSSGKKC